MSDKNRTPDSAKDSAAIAACVLNQLLALVSSMKYLPGIPGEAQHLPHLADMARTLALEWAEYFEEQVELHCALEEKKGPRA